MSCQMPLFSSHKFTNSQLYKATNSLKKHPHKHLNLHECTQTVQTTNIHIRLRTPIYLLPHYTSTTGTIPHKIYTLQAPACWSHMGIQLISLNNTHIPGPVLQLYITHNITIPDPYNITTGTIYHHQVIRSTSSSFKS